MFGYPTLVRFSWSTCQELLDSKVLSVKWYDSNIIIIRTIIRSDDEEEDQLGYAKISNYFSVKSTKPPPAKRHRYFEERGLCYCSDF